MVLEVGDAGEDVVLRDVRPLGDGVSVGFHGGPGEVQVAPFAGNFEFSRARRRQRGEN